MGTKNSERLSIFETGVKVAHERGLRGTAAEIFGNVFEQMQDVEEIWGLGGAPAQEVSDWYQAMRDELQERVDAVEAGMASGRLT